MFIGIVSFVGGLVIGYVLGINRNRATAKAEIEKAKAAIMGAVEKAKK